MTQQQVQRNLFLMLLGGGIASLILTAIGVSTLDLGPLYRISGIFLTSLALALGIATLGLTIAAVHCLHRNRKAQASDQGAIAP